MLKIEVGRSAINLKLFREIKEKAISNYLDGTDKSAENFDRINRLTSLVQDLEKYFSSN